MTDSYPIADQTALTESIVIPLGAATSARARLNREVRIRRDDGEDPEIWAASPCVSTQVRQKTNLVIETREEALSLRRILYSAIYSGCHERTSDALKRVKSQLEDDLLRQGLTITVDRQNRYDFESYQIQEIDGATGSPPAHVDLERGDIIETTGGALGWKVGSSDGEPSQARRTPTVDRLGSEKVLVDDGFSDSPRLTWITYDDIDGLATDAMERRDVRQSVVAKREQADMDALLDLFQRHAEHWCAKVWPGGTVPVGEIDFRWNPRLSYYRGMYYGRRCYEKGGSTPVIELSTSYYHSAGLAGILKTVRHELIHAWQDFHPDGHPPDAHKHHGRDFKQWVDDMETR